MDASADGYVRGEACLAAHLQRCGDDVQKDGTAPLVLVCGSATNHDGRSSALTAPNGPAQQAVILAALAAVGVEADSVAGATSTDHIAASSRIPPSNFDGVRQGVWQRSFPSFRPRSGRDA